MIMQGLLLNGNQKHSCRTSSHETINTYLFETYRIETKGNVMWTGSQHNITWVATVNAKSGETDSFKGLRKAGECCMKSGKF